MIAEPAIAPPEARDRTGSAPAPAQVWGLDAIALHDRWWASRRVQVVRRSVAPAAPTGPRLYLLLDRHDLVIFDLDRVTARLAWLGPRAMRLRLTDSEAQAYVERTIGDADGRFVAVRRVYQAASRWTHRAWLTTDPRLARLWAASFGSRDAWRSFLETADREQFASAVCPARVFDAARPREVRECLRLLLDRFATPGEALDGVYEFQPRVWAHESAIIEPGARVVAPAWIGAGVRLRSDAVVIGPDVLADDASVVADPGPIDWDAAHIPGRRAAAGRPRHRRWRRTSKRAFDVAFSLAVLVGTLPLYPLIILAIALEDGWPPFFAHRRQTTRGREFPCYKFRTMCKDAEKMKAQLAARNVCDGPSSSSRTIRACSAWAGSSDASSSTSFPSSSTSCSAT